MKHSEFDMSGKVALVTFASSGLEHIAKELAIGVLKWLLPRGELKS